jgi:hypothetical protein
MMILNNNNMIIIMNNINKMMILILVWFLNIKIFKQIQIIIHKYRSIIMIVIYLKWHKIKLWIIVK